MNLVKMSNGETVDLDEFDGCYKYVGRYLCEKGAGSPVLYALGKMYAKHHAEPKPKWRKISTAPKDGSKILGWNERFGEHETYMTKYNEKSSGYQRGLRNSGWHFPDWQEQYCAKWEPTHWMKLEDQPNAGDEGRVPETGENL